MAVTKACRSTDLGARSHESPVEVNRVAVPNCCTSRRCGFDERRHDRANLGSPGGALNFRDDPAELRPGLNRKCPRWHSANCALLRAEPLITWWPVKDSNLRSFRDGFTDQRRQAREQRQCLSANKLPCVFPPDRRLHPTTAGHPSEQFAFTRRASTSSQTPHTWAIMGEARVTSTRRAP